MKLGAALEQIGTLVVRSQGTVLFRQGQQPSGAFVVRKGRVRLMLYCADGQLTDRTVGPGHILGLPATVSDQPYSSTAETLDDSEFAWVDRRRLMRLLHRRSDLLVQVAAILTEEVQWRTRRGNF